MDDDDLRQLENFRNFIRRVQAVTGMTPTAIARAAGLHGSTVNRLMDEKNPPRHVPKDKTIRAIAAATGVLYEAPVHGLPLALRLGAANREIEEWEIPAARQSLHKPPPSWHGPAGSFLAEVADKSADRKYDPGTLLVCAPVGSLNRPLENGEQCIVRRYIGTAAEGESFETLLMVLTYAHDGDDLYLTAPNRHRDLAATDILERAGPDKRGLFEMRSGLRLVTTPKPYRPRDDDKAEILAVVLCTYSRPGKTADNSGAGLPHV